jgi:uncharacterized membrane protein YeaQ/YmgE (transglycosylase-associated protein family)
MDVVWFLVIGLAAGWLSGQLMGGGDHGLVGDLVVGVFGALLGGQLVRRHGACWRAGAGALQDAGGGATGGEGGGWWGGREAAGTSTDARRLLHYLGRSRAKTDYSDAISSLRGPADLSLPILFAFGNHERTDQTEDDGTEGLPFSGFLGLVGNHSITDGDAEYVSNRSRQAGVILYRPPGRLQ